MKLHATPRHYMPLSQSQSDDEDTNSCKEMKGEKIIFKDSFSASEGLPTAYLQTEIAVNKKNTPMSPLRKIVFFTSLFMCVLFVVIFVYVTPCANQNSIIGSYTLNQKWHTYLHKTLLTSAFEFISIGRGIRLLVVGFQNSKAGLIAFRESNGRKYWKIYLHSAPLFFMCNIIDVNLDGVPECLIVGEEGLFAALDVQKGIILWYLHNHSNSNLVDSIHNPIIVSDYDHDGIQDIIVSCDTKNEKNPSYLALISGGTGQVINSLIKVTNCNEKLSLYFPWDFNNKTCLLFFCSGNENGNLWLMSLENINITSNTSIHPLLKSVFSISQSVQKVQFYKPSPHTDHLAIIIDETKIILLKPGLNYKFEVMWSLKAGNAEYLKINTDGKFINGRSQLVVTIKGVYNTRVVGLNLTNGIEVWSMMFENESIISAFKLPAFFDKSDGLILKIISPVSSLYHNHSIKTPILSKTNLVGSTQKKNNLTLFHEILLVKCGKISDSKATNNEKKLQHCKGSVIGTACQTNVHSANSTILINTNEAHVSIGMLMVSSIKHSEAQTLDNLEISYLKLENYPNNLSCNI